MLQRWRNKNEHNEVILMMDSDEDITDAGDFAMFAQNKDLVDIAPQVDPLLAQSPTYLHSRKRLDYILLSPHLAEIAIKAGHHQFHQYMVSGHKGYIFTSGQRTFLIMKQWIGVNLRIGGLGFVGEILWKSI